MSYDVGARIVTLEWVVEVAHYVPEGSPRSITVIMSDVSSFAASPRDPKIDYGDDCLNTSMVVNDDMIQAFGIGGIMLHEPHYMFEFISGFVLLVRAAEVHCRIGA